jgi:hypothetical protein
LGQARDPARKLRTHPTALQSTRHQAAVVSARKMIMKVNWIINKVKSGALIPDARIEILCYFLNDKVTKGA